MGVNLVIQGQKFFNQFKNGVGFTDNLSDYTLNLAGSVMNKIQVQYRIDVSWNASVTNSDIWNADTSITVQSVTRTTGNWFNDGFFPGDICIWTELGVDTANITIDSISQDGLTFFYTLNSGAITDTNFAALHGITPLTAMKYKFGLLGNSESFNIQSKVSLNDQGYYGKDIGFDTGGGVRDTNFVQLIRTGQYQDWQTGSMKVRFVGNPTNKVQRFDFVHEFIIVPYYLDGELSNLQNNIIPTLLNGANSLKYSFSPGFRTVLSNPNTEKAIIVNTHNDGSVAWYGENFNGFQNNYQVNSITYTEQPSTNSADGILIGSKTRVSIVVQKNNGNFIPGERAGVYVSYLPGQTEYQNTSLTDLKENFLYDVALNNEGQPFVNGQDFITNFVISSPVGNLMTMSFDVEYSLAQKMRLSNQLTQGPINYLIAVELGDVTTVSGNSDKLLILADVKEYDTSADIPFLGFVSKFDAYAHNEQIGVVPGSTDAIGWNESGLVWDFNFQLNTLFQSVINSLEMKLIAFDPITEHYFELDSESYSVGNAIVSGGVQQLNEQSTRGYILKAADQFNDKTLNTGIFFAGVQNYDGRFGQKFKWQDWLENLGVDTVFYDATKPFNNLNYKTSNYSLLNGYEIRQAMLMNLSGVSILGVSGETDYLFLSPTLTVYDYEKDGNVVPVWTHVIETFNAANNSPLGGSVLSGQDTLFRSTWTHSGGPVPSLDPLFVINRIQQTGSIGDDIDEMSSINLPPTGQKLIPKPTFTLLDVQLIGGLVVAECLIDGSTIAPGTNYDLSTEIRDVSLVGGKMKSPSGDLKQKGNSTDIKQIAP